jgi:hypothetical protein
MKMLWLKETSVRENVKTRIWCTKNTKPIIYALSEVDILTVDISEVDIWNAAPSSRDGSCGTAPRGRLLNNSPFRNLFNPTYASSFAQDVKNV